ncbi:MAG: right-handed parallel beta-helix repeat-containing protein, partial [Planctomycetes bacterium]|nr:right-handed parallel beta-helix repeat-containing protein [Planctomycetota bacterium]
MKKYLAICVAAVFIIASGFVQADTLEVVPPVPPGSGDIIITGGVYTNIQQAIDDANPGDTIAIHMGTYTEQLTITGKGLTLTDAGDGTVIIEADTVQTGAGNVFTIDAAGHDITIENMTIRHGDYGIRSSAGNVNVLNCIFYHNGYDGTPLPAPITAVDMSLLWNTNCTNGGAIRIENSAGSEIANCIVYDNDRGIRFQDGANGNIHHNSIHNNFEAGIYLAASSYDGTTGCSNTQVHDNDSYQNYEHGVLSIGGINNTITDNQLYGNWNCGVMLWHPGEIVVQGNTVNNNNLYGFNGIGVSGDDEGGIWAAGAAGAAGSAFDFKILNNTISNNQLGGEPQANGIKLDSQLPGNGIEITDNTLTNHDIDILLLSQAATTVIEDNIFDAVGIGVQNDDISTNVNAVNNFWGDATGPYHASNNPAGLGDDVSDYVDFVPWYTDAAMTATPGAHNVTQDIWYTAIQSAIDYANDGDIIEVSNGI